MLAGPFAWTDRCSGAASTLESALVFVVPFMPIEIEPDEEEDAIMKMVNSFAKPQAALSPGNLAYHEAKDEDHSAFISAARLRGEREGLRGFFVLFAFGAVNAGVDVHETGGFSFVVLLGFAHWKTLGMTCWFVSSLHTLGFDRPEGMIEAFGAGWRYFFCRSYRVVVYCGRGLSRQSKWESQAKMGAFSAAPVFVLGALASCSAQFQRSRCEVFQKG